MGADRRRAAGEARALRLGLDLGLTLVDTAEMYADGGAEEVVGDAIRGRREEVFLVSKVLPSNASRRGVVAAAERSLARLRTDRLDLYLLHWPGPHPLEETMAGFARLVAGGKIRRYGVSNFDVGELERVAGLPGGDGVAANQVAYNLRRRGIERRVVPWCAERGIDVMAYSPLDHGALVRGDTDALARIAQRHGATPAQVALAWTIRRPGVAAIPKAAGVAHVRENAGALRLRLDEEDLRDLDEAFPPPERDVPLDVL